MNENEAITVTLTLENDEELECAVLSIFEAEEREYIALLPLDENGDNDDGQVFLYRFIDNGEDAEPDLENIEDDQEFERVSNAFNELMEEHQGLRAFAQLARRVPAPAPAVHLQRDGHLQRLRDRHHQIRQPRPHLRQVLLRGHALG